jgi:hypothetical protein
MSEDRLWIVCPSYTDVVAFTMLRKRVLDLAQDAPLLDRPVRFVVVDDTAGCDDDIVQLGAFDDVMVVTPPFNLGHQRAIVCGLRLIIPELRDSDLVVTMDSDGEDRPEDLPRLLEPLINTAGERNRVCVAWRTKRHESVGFRVMYFFFRIMFRSLTGVTVRSGNYAAYRGWTARRMLLHPYFDLCYSSTLVSLDLALTPVPCERGERYAGRSRMNLSRLLMHGVRMLMPFTDRIALRALATFTATFGVSILLSLVALATKIFTSAAIPGWATTTLLGILILSFLALSNFVVLFVVFSESRGVSLTSLEAQLERSARGAPAPPN